MQLIRSRAIDPTTESCRRKLFNSYTVYIGGASPSSLSWPEISRSYWLLRLNSGPWCGNVEGLAVLLPIPDELVDGCPAVMYSGVEACVFGLLPGRAMQGQSGMTVEASSNDSRYGGNDVQSGLHRH